MLAGKTVDIHHEAMTLVRGEDGVVSAMRSAESQSLIRRGPLTPGQRWKRVLIVLAVIGGVVAAVAQIRKPDPYYTVVPIAWSKPVVSHNGREVNISYSYGACAVSGVSTVVRETTTQVWVTLVQVSAYSDDGSGCPMIAFRGKAVALLSRPLGARKLRDGRCHERIVDASLPEDCSVK
jgi:hypothetical protein